MKYTYLCNGTVYLINPLCFPNLSSDSKEIPNFFDVLRTAWINHDKETLILFIRKLDERSGQAIDTDEKFLELLEIHALAKVLEAEISNANRDWKEASEAFSNLRFAIESMSGKNCVTNRIISVIKHSEERCGYFASSF
jgi:hypothetical protein